MEIEEKLICETELTEAESELYDRQIRLWGLESQKRLKTAKVLISGLNGIGAEVTKNIILSGVNSVKLHDDELVTEQDFCSQFLAPRESLGKNRAEASIDRARALNPMVEISFDTEPLEKKEAEFFKCFDVVVIIGANNYQLLRIDEICRENKIKFFSGDLWGVFGYCFSDLQHHEFIEDVAKHKVVSKPDEKLKTELVTTTIQRELEFPPYSIIMDFDFNSNEFRKKVKKTGPAFILLRILQEFREKFNRDPNYKLREEEINELKMIRDEIADSAVVPEEYFEMVFSQISPAAAIVGGILAQEIIKAITKREPPNLNIFLYDPELSCGFVETIA